MGALEGRIAWVTGAGRGQGRNHAVALARAGADVASTDLCADLAMIAHPLEDRADLAATERLVLAEGRRCVAAACDVRDPASEHLTGQVIDVSAVVAARFTA